ncbi:MAG: hypothetical protein V3V08_17610 [Nannocystaceae bacterium]
MSVTPNAVRGSGGDTSRSIREPKPGVFGHGWARASDRIHGEVEGGRAAGPRRGRGLPLVLVVTLAVLTWVGISKVRTTVRVLELGKQITALTDQRAQLLDRRRRLETERAYLRHPDRIRRAATRRFDMLPASPDRIRLVSVTVRGERGGLAR